VFLTGVVGVEVVGNVVDCVWVLLVLMVLPGFEAVTEAFAEELTFPEEA
jgi:hypothetical protein